MKVHLLFACCILAGHCPVVHGLPSILQFLYNLFFGDSYEPECDTTRAQRNEIRENITRILLQEGEFTGILPGEILGAPGFDPQGSVLGYVFPIPYSFLPFYRMRSQSDAMLHVFCNPRRPGPAYFGITQYLSSFSTFGFFSGLVRLRPSAPSVEMTDSLNQLKLNSTAKDGNPFGHTSIIITTPDQGSAAAVKRAVAAAGLNASAVNFQVIPSLLDDRISFGLGLRGSMFVTGTRFRGWEDAEEAVRYGSYREPVLYFLGPRRTPDPFDTPPFSPRGGIQNELALLPSFEALIAKITAEENDNGFSLVSNTTMNKSGANDPFNCLLRFDEQPRGTCVLANQDIAYGAHPSIQLEPNGFQLVVGVIHTLTELATYATVGLASSNRDTAELEFVDTATLSGSIEAFVSEDDSIPDSDKFFVLLLSTDCSTAPIIQKCITYAPELYIERTFLEPITRTGPAFEDLISARVLSFAPTA